MKIDQKKIQKEVQIALAEDMGEGDVSAALLKPNSMSCGQIISREPLFLAGQPWVQAVFETLDPHLVLEWHFKEGSWVDAPAVLAQFKGNTRAILTGERTALNFLQTLSATATQTYHYVQALVGTTTQLLDTRKTIPGLRYAQKYAVACAGGVNHRMGLYDAILIKENHIQAYHSITQVLQAAREHYPQLFVEIEVTNLEELQEALESKPDRILLDNFTLEGIQQAVSINNSNIPLEVSGSVNLQNIRQIALLGVHFISVGALTKSIKAIDLSLLLD